MSDQQYIPPDPRLQTVGRAAVRYQRAGQVAADAVYAMFTRLAQRAVTTEQAAELTVAAVPAIMEEILRDEEIMNPPQPYQYAQPEG